MPSQPQNKIIELERVVVGYDNNVIIPQADFSVNEGDFIAVTGPNGGGKTSLLRVLLGLLKPMQGNVKFFCNGQGVKILNVGYLPQKNTIDNRFPITVEEVVQSGLQRGKSIFAKRMTLDDATRVTMVLNLVGMETYRHSAIGKLSGGQLQRVLFARSIVSNPSVLVLDEPLSYVDKTFEARFYEIVEDLAKHTTIILVSHEMSRIMEMANRHIIVDHGIEDCHAHNHYVPVNCK